MGKMPVASSNRSSENANPLSTSRITSVPEGGHSTGGFALPSKPKDNLIVPPNPKVNTHHLDQTAYPPQSPLKSEYLNPISATQPVALQEKPPQRVRFSEVVQTQSYTQDAPAVIITPPHVSKKAIDAPKPYSGRLTDSRSGSRPKTWFTDAHVGRSDNGKGSTGS